MVMDIIAEAEKTSERSVQSHGGEEKTSDRS